MRDLFRSNRKVVQVYCLVSRPRYESIRSSLPGQYGYNTLLHPSFYFCFIPISTISRLSSPLVFQSSFVITARYKPILSFLRPAAGDEMSPLKSPTHREESVVASDDQ
jgi:hypothetical protein